MHQSFFMVKVICHQFCIWTLPVNLVYSNYEIKVKVFVIGLLHFNLTSQFANLEHHDWIITSKV